MNKWFDYILLFLLAYAVMELLTAVLSAAAFASLSGFEAATYSKMVIFQAVIAALIVITLKEKGLVR